MRKYDLWDASKDECEKVILMNSTEFKIETWNGKNGDWQYNCLGCDRWPIHDCQI